MQKLRIVIFMLIVVVSAYFISYAGNLFLFEFLEAADLNPFIHYINPSYVDVLAVSIITLIVLIIWKEDTKRQVYAMITIFFFSIFGWALGLIFYSLNLFKQDFGVSLYMGGIGGMDIDIRQYILWLLLLICLIINILTARNRINSR